MNKYSKNTLKGCVLKSKELCKLHNDYPSDPDKIEIKEEVLSKYQLAIANFYNILLVMLKNWCVAFLIKKSMCFIMKAYNFI